MIATKSKKEKSVKHDSQVIGCRVSKNQWHQFEQKCLANQIPMSRILQEAVSNYIKK